MGRSPCCCDEAEVKKGPWNEEEDKKLVEYIQKHGGHVASWRGLPRAAGLNRCGKSCRLRWTNYLRPGIKRGKFADDEERLIIHLHSLLGNKWSTIATHLQGRTDNEIKNYWNTHIRKKLMLMGIDPVTHQRRTSNLDAPAPPSLLAALLSAAAGLGGLDSALLQVQLQQQLVQAICYGTSNGIAPPPPPMANIKAVANAILSSCPILPNYQIVNSLSSHADRPGYLCNISNAAEQEMVQQLDTTSVVFSSYAAPTACCSGGSVSAATPQEAAAAARVQDFAGLEPVEALPDLYSVEDDLSWNDILDAISTPHTL